MNFLQYSRSDLAQRLKNHDVPEQHTKKLFQLVYQSNCLNPFKQSGIPHKAHCLDKLIPVDTLKIYSSNVSPEDGSIKFLLNLKDQQKIETVLIPEKRRLTLCLSTQVGCRQKCVFCQTGRMGLIRNLEVKEIVAQIITVKKWLQTKDLQSLPLTNIVFMGMGEPLDNVDCLIKAITIIQDPWGLGIAPKRLTVSTAGHLAGLKKILASDLNFSLALSLHSANNFLRSKLMPINKDYPLQEVIKTIKQFTLKNKKKVFVQYTLFKGINDSTNDAYELSKLLQGTSAKVNLIPFNPIAGSTLSSPAISTVKSFQEILLNEKIRTTIRFSKGQDIQAACGQLWADKTTIT